MRKEHYRAFTRMPIFSQTVLVSTEEMVSWLLLAASCALVFLLQELLAILKKSFSENSPLASSFCLHREFSTRQARLDYTTGEISATDLGGFDV